MSTDQKATAHLAIFVLTFFVTDNVHLLQRSRFSIANRIQLLTYLLTAPTLSIAHIIAACLPTVGFQQTLKWDQPYMFALYCSVTSNRMI